MSILKSLEKKFSISIERLKKAEKNFESRFGYQKEYIDFDIKSGSKVLDLGSGNYPFPFATHLVDLFVENDFHRGGVKLDRDKRPFYVADIEKLPFADNTFDFIYCSHVLEHVEDPEKACREIMRVGKRGYIETPTRLSDMFYNFSNLHKWHIEMAGKVLIFIEYSEREKKGTGSSYFMEQQLNPYENEIKKIVYANRNIFCNMILWESVFEFHVFDCNGKQLC